MEKTKEWAWKERRKKGDFPSIDEQGEVYDKHYRRHQNIKKRK